MGDSGRSSRVGWGMTPRKRRLRPTGAPLAVLAAASLALGACADIVGTVPAVAWSSSLQQGSFSFDVESLTPPPTAVSVDGRRIRLEGVAVTPSHCEDVDLRARTQGQVIELHVRIVEARNGCALGIRTFAYTVEAEHPPGEYRVIARYLHVPDGGAWQSGVTADTSLVIE